MFHFSCDAPGSLRSEWVWGTSVLLRGFPAQQQRGATFWKVGGELRAGSEEAFAVGYEPVWEVCGAMSGLAPAKNNFIDKKIN